VKKLIERVDAILFHEWDPIGVNNAAPPREYSSYAPQVAKLVMQNAAPEIIAGHLDRIAIERMCLKPDPELARRVALLLLALPKSDVGES
jgi:hypothetical protein